MQADRSTKDTSDGRAGRIAVWILFRIVGAALAFALFYLVLTLIAQRYGVVTVEIIAFASLIAAAWMGHTPESRAYAEDFLAALGMVGMSQKVAAITMGISEAQLSAQLAGTEQMSAWREASMPIAFRRELYRLRLQRFGRNLVIEQPELMEILGFVRQRMCMAKATLQTVDRQEDVA